MTNQNETLLPETRQHLEIAPETAVDGRCCDNLTPEQRSMIGYRGGIAVSQNRDHMKEIGRKGGLKISSDREHMRLIGQKGGRSKRR